LPGDVIRVTNSTATQARARDRTQIASVACGRTAKLPVTVPCEMSLTVANCHCISLITPLVSGVAGLNASSSSKADMHIEHLMYKYIISANADGPRDAASHKFDYIALPTKYNYQATSVGR